MWGTSTSTCFVYENNNPNCPSANGIAFSGTDKKDDKWLNLPELVHGSKDSHISHNPSHKPYQGVKVRMPVKEMLQKIRSSKDGSSPNFQDRSDGHAVKQTCSVDSIPERLKYNRFQSPEAALAVFNRNCHIIPNLQQHMQNEELVSTTEGNRQQLKKTKCHHDKNVNQFTRSIESPDSSTTLQSNISDYCTNLRSISESLNIWTASTIPTPQLQSIGICGKPTVMTQGQANQTVFSFFQFQIMCEEDNLQKSFSDISALDDNKNRLLHKAVNEGKRARAYVLAKRLKLHNKINTKDTKKRTALHWAAEKNQHLIVKDLLSFGADVNERDNMGKSPLHLCAANGYIKVMEVLKNAKENGQSLQVEAFDKDGLTPLHYAVLAHNAVIKELDDKPLSSYVKKCLNLRKEILLQGVKCLLRMGADPLTREPKSNQTSLQLASSEDNTEMVSFFGSLYPDMQDLLNENNTLHSMIEMMVEESLLH